MSKRVSTFEHRVKKMDDKDSYIDRKVGEKSLTKFTDMIVFNGGLKEHELSKYILISDGMTLKKTRRLTSNSMTL